MQKKHIWNRVPATAALMIAGALGLTGVACGENPAANNEFGEASETAALFDVPGLVFAGTCSFNPANGNMLLTLAPSDKVIVGRDSGNGNMTINGNATNCQAASATNVKLLNVTVSGAGGVGTGEVLVLDYSQGTFAQAASAAGGTSGTWIDLGGDSGAVNDYISVRTLNSNAVSQNITIGAHGVSLTASNWNDILFTGGHNPNSLTFSLGGGNDRVNARGTAAFGGGPLQRMRLFGNDGADTFLTSGGNFNDTYSGGNGNDTIIVSPNIVTGHQVFDGNTGVDTVDFSARTLGTRIYNSGTFVSGDIATATELHRVANAEILIGGAGPDLIQGGAVSTNMWLYGGPGNDNFVQGGTTTGDSNDIISGGPGIDVVNYGTRTIAVNVSLDGNPNDGSVGEIDNVGADVENITSGTGNDVLVGNANSNVLDGGNGTNTLVGGAGDDTFLQTSVVGNDNVSCGLGTDTVDYTPHNTAIVAVLDGVTTSGFIAGTEADILGADCENLNGAGSGSGNQTLTGNASDNVISAGASTSATVALDCQGGQDVAIVSGSPATTTTANCEIIVR